MDFFEACDNPVVKKFSEDPDYRCTQEDFVALILWMLDQANLSIKTQNEIAAIIDLNLSGD